MVSEHKKRQYWKHGRPRDADTGEVTGLDGNIYTMYTPTQPSDTQRLWDEFDRMSALQLERARGVLGYRPMPRELIKLRKTYGESATLIQENGGLGIFHIGGRCAELLAFALTREDKRFDLQGVGTEAYEGSVFLIRPVSLWTQFSCRRKREKKEKKERERQKKKGKGKDGGNKDQGPPAGAQAAGKHDAKASAFRTVNSGHWAASRNGPWAFGGAG